jgi:hypothetical protein
VHEMVSTQMARAGSLVGLARRACTTSLGGVGGRVRSAPAIFSLGPWSPVDDIGDVGGELPRASDSEPYANLQKLGLELGHILTSI